MAARTAVRPARKGVVIIIDGLGDRPSPVLGGRTPLEAAHTPNLDALAGAGQYGMVQQVPPGQRPHTHLGVGLLFGLQPEAAGSLARGPIEAAGLGWHLAPEDLVIRANLATLQPASQGWTLLDRRAGRIAEGGELAEMLQELDLGEGVYATFRPTEQHRGALRLAGPGLSDRISGTDPGNVPLPTELPACRPLDDDASAGRTADLINRFTAISHDLLKDHPVNRNRLERGLPPATGVICRGAGFVTEGLQRGALADLKVAVVAGCSTVVGLSRLLGFDVIRDCRFSADLNTDLAAKVSAVLDALRDHDLVYLHIKAPDILAHDLDPAGKQSFLERIDRAIDPLLGADLVIAVGGDHGTDSNTGWHIDDPVPSLLCAQQSGEKDPRPNFGEGSCRDGPMGELDSMLFLQRVMAALEISASA